MGFKNVRRAIDFLETCVEGGGGRSGMQGTEPKEKAAGEKALSRSSGEKGRKSLGGPDCFTQATFRRTQYPNKGSQRGREK